MITVTAPLRLWTGADGRMHFLAIPDAQSVEIRLEASAMGARRGFGSIRVECAIGEITWRTSVFPQKSGGYFLPMKADVCRRAGIAAGDEVTVALEII